jgi:iron(III) transport system ATP-binding protein
VVAIVSVNISVRHALKKFGDSVIIPDLSLEIKEGEFLTLLGPSGCGKTTFLRMIAGFTPIDGGEFYFGGELINDVDPSKRNIGMVFQNYAIFPHLSVRRNIEFGLKHHKLPKEEIARRTDEFLALMQIDKLADRMPDKLSGGQQQRVALARALCIQPRVLLMDEPLSNLDAKLRVEMRTVIKGIHQRLGITTVYVTHDQEEAMAVSDRVAVMNGGVIQHLGTPKNIYQRPCNLFVSSFIGRSNLLEGRLATRQGKPCARIGEYEIPLTSVRGAYSSERKILISVRPGELGISGPEAAGIPAVIDDCVFLGQNTHYFMHLENGQEIEAVQESTMESTLPRGARVRLAVDERRINVFTEDGSVNILEGVCNDIE